MSDDVIFGEWTVYVQRRRPGSTFRWEWEAISVNNNKWSLTQHGTADTKIGAKIGARRRIRELRRNAARKGELSRTSFTVKSLAR